MAVRDFPLPRSASMRERAEAWVREPGTPVPVRPAATVMFLRDAPAGFPGPDGAGDLEVFVLKRVASMAFAPSMHVFPGGGVDPRDADPRLPWSGPAPAAWADAIGVGEEEARMLVCAAAREVFEESGVLLAGPGDGPGAGTVLADLSDPAWRERRRRLVDRELSFAEVLTAQGLVLRTDLLGHRAHWVTPEFESRRYDTHFFAATVPAGQVADHDTSEAEAGRWVRPADLLRAADAGEAMLLPPTRVCLEELAAAGDAASVVGSRGAIPAVMPRLVGTDAGVVLRAEGL